MQKNYLIIFNMKKTLILLVAVLSLGSFSSVSAIGISKFSLTNKVEESKKGRKC